jgi:hypothetical protein
MTLIPITQLADYLRQRDARPRVSASDGEWFRCPSCARRGYGVDAWLPMTTEYWATYRGRLILSACKACRADVSRRACGIVPAGPVFHVQYGSATPRREAMAA